MIRNAGSTIEECKMHGAETQEGWLGNQDSNLGLRIQSPLSYH